MNVEKVKEFLLDPYKAIIISLLVLILLNFQLQGGISIFPSIAAIVLVSVIVDSAIGYIKTKRLYLSETAVISGLILSLVIAPQTPLPYLLAAPALAQLSKHILRYKNKPVFNPAAFGMFLIFLINPSGEAWWGNLNAIAAAVLGIYVSWRIGRLPASFSFLIGFVVLSLVSRVLSGGVIDITPLLPLALSQVFMAFFMVVEPKSSTHKMPAQLIYGAVIALVSVLGLVFSFPAPLLLGLLIGDLVAAMYK